LWRAPGKKKPAVPKHCGPNIQRRLSLENSFVYSFFHPCQEHRGTGFAGPLVLPP